MTSRIARIASQREGAFAALCLIWASLGPVRAEETTPPSPFEDWRGSWRGECRLDAPTGKSTTFLMTLVVSPIEGSSDWRWRIEYASDSDAEPSVRDYAIRAEGSHEDHFIIDERNGIQIDCFRVGSALWSEFELESVRLTSRFERVPEAVLVEIVTWEIRPGRECRTGGPEHVVRSYRRISVQRGSLARVAPAIPPPETPPSRSARRVEKK